jgi:hypothetical protein
MLQNSSFITLEEAVQALRQQDNNTYRANIETLRRRLYDISNVLMGAGLIEKVYCASLEQKPCFRWVQDTNTSKDASSDKIVPKKLNNSVSFCLHPSHDTTPSSSALTHPNTSIPFTTKRLSFTFAPPSYSLSSSPTSSRTNINTLSLPSLNLKELVSTSLPQSCLTVEKRKHEDNENNDKKESNSKRFKLSVSNVDQQFHMTSPFNHKK